MVRRLAISVIVTIVLAATGLRMSSASGPFVTIELQWDHLQPATIKYYNVYVSDTQGSFGRAYARITRLPTDRHGVQVRIPVASTGVTRYIVVTAVDGQGTESGWSNQLQTNASFTVTDLGSP